MLHGELRDYRAMLQQGAVGRRDDRLHVFAHRGGERPVEIARTARRDEYGLQTMLHRCRLLDPLRCGGGIRVVWVEQRGKARCFWQDCAQQLDLFDGYVDREIRQTRDVAAGMRKALDEAVDDVDIHMRQFRRHAGNPLVFAVGETPFDEDVLPLHVTEIAQPAQKSAEQVAVHGGLARALIEESDSPDFFLLRKRGRRAEQSGDGGENANYATAMQWAPRTVCKDYTRALILNSHRGFAYTPPIATIPKAEPAMSKFEREVLVDRRRVAREALQRIARVDGVCAKHDHSVSNRLARLDHGERVLVAWSRDRRRSPTRASGSAPSR